MLLASVLVVSSARAETAFAGKDAAYIDWSVKNCEATSTDKEHRLVDEANAKGRDRFVATWMTESGKLAASAETPSKRESLCADVKGWYGPQGSRIAGLITWKSAATGVPVGQSRAAGESSGQRGRGRRRQ